MFSQVRHLTTGRRVTARVTLMLFAVLLLYLSTTAMSGCTSTPTAVTWERLSCEVSGKSDHSYSDLPRVAVFTDSTGAQALTGQVYPKVLEQVISVDFSTAFVVAVFQGEQDSTGYSVEVADAKLEGNTVFVYAVFHEPSSQDLKGDTVTSPYCVLKVEKTSKLRGAFDFALVVSEQEIFRQTYDIP